jgi:hypothetical protein
MPLFVCFALVSASVASGQTLVIGGPGSAGCQDPSGSPTLSNGDLASATIDYAYDPVAEQLTLVVTNTSPVVAESRNALITNIYFNFPAGVTGASLVSQTGSGGAAADFNLVAGPVLANCFGSFSAALSTSSGNIRGGIANAAAPLVGGPPGTAVIGPVTFVLDIATGAVLTAQDFADAQSAGGAYSTGAAMKFQGSGVNGEASGTLGAGPLCAFPATVIDLGSACGLLLDPILTMTPPVLGQITTLTITSAFPNATVFLFFSVGAPTPTLLGNGCTVYIDLNPNNLVLWPLMVTDNAGTLAISALVPTDPAFIGLEVTIQARLCAPSGPVGPFFPDWASNGIRVRFGCE